MLLFQGSNQGQMIWGDRAFGVMPDLTRYPCISAVLCLQENWGQIPIVLENQGACGLFGRFFGGCFVNRRTTIVTEAGTAENSATTNRLHVTTLLCTMLHVT